MAGAGSKVAVGDTVRFINKDKFDHDVYLVRTANRNDVLVPTTTIQNMCTGEDSNL